MQGSGQAELKWHSTQGGPSLDLGAPQDSKREHSRLAHNPTAVPVGSSTQQPWRAAATKDAATQTVEKDFEEAKSLCSSSTEPPSVQSKDLGKSSKQTLSLSSSKYPESWEAKGKSRAGSWNDEPLDFDEKAASPHWGEKILAVHPSLQKPAEGVLNSWNGFPAVRQSASPIAASGGWGGPQQDCEQASVQAADDVDPWGADRRSHEVHQDVWEEGGLYQPKGESQRTRSDSARSACLEKIRKSAAENLGKIPTRAELIKAAKKTGAPEPPPPSSQMPAVDPSSPAYTFEKFHRSTDRQLDTASRTRHSSRNDDGWIERSTSRSENQLRCTEKPAGYNGLRASTASRKEAPQAQGKPFKADPTLALSEGGWEEEEPSFDCSGKLPTPPERPTTKGRNESPTREEQQLKATAWREAPIRAARAAELAQIKTAQNALIEDALETAPSLEKAERARNGWDTELVSGLSHQGLRDSVECSESETQRWGDLPKSPSNSGGGEGGWGSRSTVLLSAGIGEAGSVAAHGTAPQNRHFGTSTRSAPGMSQEREERMARFSAAAAKIGPVPLRASMVESANKHDKERRAKREAERAVGGTASDALVDPESVGWGDVEFDASSCGGGWGDDSLSRAEGRCRGGANGEMTSDKSYTPETMRSHPRNPPSTSSPDLTMARLYAECMTYSDDEVRAESLALKTPPPPPPSPVEMAPADAAVSPIEQDARSTAGK